MHRAKSKAQQACVEMAEDIANFFAGAKVVDDASADSGLVLDEALLAAFRAGDREAFAMLYRRHSRSVFQFAFYMAGDADSADELTQEVFVWLIHHPAAFDAERGSLPAFLGGVARKFLQRKRRAESRWSGLDDAVQAIWAMSMAQAPGLTADAALDAGRVREAIALLPIRYREAVVLCDLQELEYAEAARAMGCAVGTVRSRLHRGRALLARKLRPEIRGGDGDAL